MPRPRKMVRSPHKSFPAPAQAVRQRHDPLPLSARQHLHPLPQGPQTKVSSALPQRTTRQRLALCPAHRVVSLEMSPCDDLVLSGSTDDTVRLWDLRTPNCQVRRLREQIYGQLLIFAPHERRTGPAQHCRSAMRRLRPGRACLCRRAQHAPDHHDVRPPQVRRRAPPVQLPSTSSN